MLSFFHAVKTALLFVSQVGLGLVLRDQPMNADRFSLRWDPCIICIFF